MEVTCPLASDAIADLAVRGARTRVSNCLPQINSVQLGPAFRAVSRVPCRGTSANSRRRTPSIATSAIYLMPIRPTDGRWRRAARSSIPRSTSLSPLFKPRSHDMAQYPWLDCAEIILAWPVLGGAALRVKRTLWHSWASRLHTGKKLARYSRRLLHGTVASRDTTMCNVVGCCQRLPPSRARCGAAALRGKLGKAGESCGSCGYGSRRRPEVWLDEIC